MANEDSIDPETLRRGFDGLPYGSVVRHVAEGVVSLSLAMPALPAAVRQTLMAHSRELRSQTDALAALPAGGGGGAARRRSARAAAGEARARREAARLALELLRALSGPGLGRVHAEDRWAFASLALELLRP